MLEVLSPVFDWIQNWAQPIGAIGSFLLTFFLVALYRQQKNLLRESYNADHRAVVEVEDYEVDGERLVLQLSNVGNGVGTDLELVTATVFEETDDFAPGITTSRIELTKDEIKRGRQSIKPHEDNVTFRTRPALGFEYSDGETHRQGYRRAMNELDRVDVEVLRVHWFLRYQDLRGKCDGQYISGIEVDVDPEINSLEELSEQGARMIHDGLTLDLETLDMDLSEAITGDQRTVI